MKELLVLVLVGCVASHPFERIVGGTNAYPGEFPSIASLEVRQGSGYSHNCGGSLIRTKYVLTAAHCVTSPASSYRVVLGRHTRLDSDPANEQIFTVNRIILHPGYTGSGSNGFVNDIALLELNGNANINSNRVALATLPNTNENFSGSCTLAGWGRLVGAGSSPNILQKVGMKVLTNPDCTDAMTNVNGGVIHNSHICVQETDKSACSGDSGGPMYCNNKLAGVTSWVVGSCLTTFPSVYGRVTSFLPWINSNAP